MRYRRPFMAGAAIRTEKLTKTYGGGVVALADLDLEVDHGEIFGFIGPNGAGKTTTIRLLLDLLRPTSGRAEVLGLDVRNRGIEARARIGYLPGELHLDERLTARATLRFFNRLHGIGDEPGEALAKRLDLPLDRPIGQLSRGNKQKVGIVQAFAHDPELVILDEPTSGLDPDPPARLPGSARGGDGPRRDGVPVLARALGARACRERAWGWSATAGCSRCSRSATSSATRRTASRSASPSRCRRICSRARRASPRRRSRARSRGWWCAARWTRR